jgi:hypothetical protein
MGTIYGIFWEGLRSGIMKFSCCMIILAASLIFFIFSTFVHIDPKPMQTFANQPVDLLRASVVAYSTTSRRRKRLIENFAGWLAFWSFISKVFIRFKTFRYISIK